MATIDPTSAVNSHRKGFAKNVKKLSLKIDMTPMVDLGFLLITFFIFTASMSEAKTMNLFMPASDGTTNTAESGALHILIGKQGSFYYYEGKLKDDGSNIIKTNITGLRNGIINKKKQVIEQYIPNAACEAEAVANKKSVDDCKQQKLMVLIKPNADADYSSIVNVMDEMAINKVARYALMEPEKQELPFIK